MARDTSGPIMLDDLSLEEIGRLEARLFCAGGPPDSISRATALGRALKRATAISDKRDAQPS